MNISTSLRLYLQPLLITAVGAGIAGLLYLLSPEPEIITPPRPMLLVDAIYAEKQDVSMKIKTQGSVSARTRTNLISEVSGLIVEISPSFVVGGYFEKGSFLLRIDDRNYLAELKRTEAAVASANTQVAKERGLADFALTDWERIERPDGETQDATALALRKPQLEEAKANLAFAEADLFKKQSDLERTIIQAPYDGIVESRAVDIGQFVGAGSSLAITFAIDRVEIRLPIPHHELEFLTLPDPLRSDLSIAPEVTLATVVGNTRHQWSGRIVRTEGRVDERTRILYAVAEVNRPYEIGEGKWQDPLRVGSFVEAIIEGNQLRDVIVLPRGALRPGNIVWTINQQQELQITPVDVIRADESFVYLSSGVEAGALVCMTSLESPLPGTLVKYQLPAAESTETAGHE